MFAPFLPAKDKMFIRFLLQTLGIGLTLALIWTNNMRLVIEVICKDICVSWFGNTKRKKNVTGTFTVM